MSQTTTYLSKSQITDLKIVKARTFLYGQLELYKIEFARTLDNRYLEVMNNLNETIETLKYLEEAIFERRKRYAEARKKASIAN